MGAEPTQRADAGNNACVLGSGVETSGGAHRVHTADDGRGADAVRDAGEARVNEARDGTALGRALAHDARLRAAVHERLQRVPVHLEPIQARFQASTPTLQGSTGDTRQR